MQELRHILADDSFYQPRPVEANLILNEAERIEDVASSDTYFYIFGGTLVLVECHIQGITFNGYFQSVGGEVLVIRYASFFHFRMQVFCISVLWCGGKTNVAYPKALVVLALKLARSSLFRNMIHGCSV